MQESPKPSADPAVALDAAFTALRAYGVGSGRGPLMPLDEAVAAAGRNPATRASLEARFVEVVSQQPPVSALAREYVCRQLARIGADASAKALAALLDDKECAEAARSALESIPGERASTVLREQLGRATGVQKAGIAHSLGARRDRGSVAALVALLNDSDRQVVSAAAGALGRIGTLDAAQALNERAARNDGSLTLVLADARLSCAEALLEDGRKADAVTIYKSLADPSHPPQVQLAARRGLLVAVQGK
jgi:HEAT repeat protein